MNDDALYRKYRRTIKRRPNRGISVRGFVVSAIFAALLLAIAIYFNKEAELPGWCVPVGILAGAMGTVAFQRWDLTSWWIRKRWTRFAVFVVLFGFGDTIWHWLSPQHANGFGAVFAVYIAFALGMFLTTWAQIVDPLDNEKKPDRASDS